MPALPSIQIDLEFPAKARKSNIVIGEGIIASAGTLILEKLGKLRIIVISDKIVGGIYMQLLGASLGAAGHEILSTITVKAGEGSKDIATLQSVIAQVMDCGIDRNTAIVALGGGVVGDLAGVVASLALRGITLIQIPTTLLAQVDSAVGGKNGINTAAGKNTLGSFWQPHMVLVDAATLDSLPIRQMRAGYAEVVKYGIIGDADFFAWCKAHGSALLQGNRDAQIHAIATSLRHKARIVMEDELETSGSRALLNLGHTFGHALESITGYDDTLLHGEAVAIGMVMALRFSANLGICSSQAWRDLAEHLKAVGLPISPPPLSGGRSYDVDRLVELMGQDKKASHGKLTLILARSIGDCLVMKDASVYMVRDLWHSVLNGR